jgi:hypothetical protein
MSKWLVTNYPDANADQMIIGDVGFTRDDHVERLREQIRTLSETLKFYAHQSYYPLPVYEVKNFAILKDGGSKARATLADMA